MLFLAGVLSSPLPIDAPKEILHKVAVLSDEYGVDPILVLKIAKCESGLNETARHENVSTTTGKVLSLDFGLLQVNSTHQEEMSSLGLEFTNPTQSLIYGLMLLKRDGLRHWTASASCQRKLGVDI